MQLDGVECNLKATPLVRWSCNINAVYSLETLDIALYLNACLVRWKGG